MCFVIVNYLCGTFPSCLENEATAEGKLLGHCQVISDKAGGSACLEAAAQPR
jgi:hypothetical protein